MKSIIYYSKGKLRYDENKFMLYRRLKLESIDKATTRILIEHLKNKTSTGVDGKSNKLLKISISELVKPFTIIINEMLNNVIFPEQLKISKVVPLLKANEQTLITNYRPIALLPSISNIFEYAILEQLSFYFSKMNCLPPKDLGFVRNIRQSYLPLAWLTT